MDDLIRAQTKNGNRVNADFWINRPGNGGDSDQQDQIQDPAKREEEERIRQRVLYGRYNNFDNQGRMTPEYEYFLKEKEKHDLGIDKYNPKPHDADDWMRKKARETRDRRMTINYSHEKKDREREYILLFGDPDAKKRDLDEEIRDAVRNPSNKVREYGRNFWKNETAYRERRSGKRNDDDPTAGMTDREKDTYKWRMEYKDKWGYDPLADAATQERQKKAYAARKKADNE